MLTLEYLKTLSREQQIKEKVKEYIKCCNDPLYTIGTYFTVMDPTIGRRVPFSLYTYQERAILNFEEFNFNMTMKTRQTGLTTISQAYTAWFMATKPNMIVSAIAIEKKISIKFLRGVRDFLDDTRTRAPWLMPLYDVNNNAKVSFGLTNGSAIQAEANTPDSGRGLTLNLVIVDESVSSETKVSLRNKETGEVKEFSIGDIFYDEKIK